MRECKDWELARMAFECFSNEPVNSPAWDALPRPERTKWLCAAAGVVSMIGAERFMQMTPPCCTERRLRPEKPFPRNFIDEAVRRLTGWL